MFFGARNSTVWEYIDAIGIRLLCSLLETVSEGRYP